ncbi:MAG: biotin--[acetyl-CoA-carboxylase] ligase [Archaeoglobus sp.]|nr:MAG: biotin--[acetyl-CoA-carboxylase] ligase [Archaeoglobus sp.]
MTAMNPRRIKITREDTSLIIFRALKKGEFSGVEIANKLGISRTSIWKAIEKIRGAGYNITSKKGRGYKLIGHSEFPVYEIAELCFSNGVEEFYFFDEIDSTNSFLKRLLSDRQVVAVALALKQTAGRGRLGRRWLSDLGGLYVSISHRVRTNLSDVPKITICSGVAVCKAIRNFGCNATLKWPNDILLNGKKLSGILCELCGESDDLWVVIGVGVNVKNRVPEYATNLSDYHVTLGEVCIGILSSLFNYLSMLPKKWEDIRREWLELAKPMMGKKVEVKSAGNTYTGIFEGIDESGALLLNTGEKKIRVYSGDCFYGG